MAAPKIEPYEVSEFETAREEINELINSGELFAAFDKVALLSIRSSDDRQLIRAWMTKAKYFDLIGSRELELSLYRVALEKFAECKDADICSHVAWMAYNEAVIHTQNSEYKSALAAYDKAMEIAERGDEYSNEVLSRSLYNKAGVLKNLDDTDGALETYRRLIEKYQNSDDLDEMEQVARSRASLATGLMSMDEYEAAQQVLTELFEMPRVALDTMPELLRLRSESLRSLAKWEVSRDEVARTELFDLYKRLRGSANEKIRDVAAFSLFNAAGIDMDLTQFENARDLFERFLKDFKSDEKSLNGMLEACEIGLREVREKLKDRKAENEKDKLPDQVT